MEPEENDSDVYYKLYQTDRGLCVVCMQWFDEYDYDQKKFIVSKETSEPLSFKDEDKAIQFLNDNFKQSYINLEYRRPSVNSINGEYGLPD